MIWRILSMNTCEEILIRMLIKKERNFDPKMHTSEQEACTEKSLKQLMTHCWMSRPSASIVLTVDSNNPGFGAQEILTRVSLFVLSTLNWKFSCRNSILGSGYLSIRWIMQSFFFCIDVCVYICVVCAYIPLVNSSLVVHWVSAPWICPSIALDSYFLLHLLLPSSFWLFPKVLSCSLWYLQV